MRGLCSVCYNVRKFGNGVMYVVLLYFDLNIMPTVDGEDFYALVAYFRI